MGAIKGVGLLVRTKAAPKLMQEEECRRQRSEDRRNAEGRYGSRGLSHLGIGGFRLTC
jgi:hypothetical protein